VRICSRYRSGANRRIIGSATVITVRHNQLLNKTRGTVKKVVCSSSKLPFNINQLLTKLTSFIGHGGSVLDVELQEKSYELKKRYSQEGTLFVKLSALHYNLIMIMTECLQQAPII